jgi:hypothetical protein
VTVSERDRRRYVPGLRQTRGSVPSLYPAQTALSTAVRSSFPANENSRHLHFTNPSMNAAGTGAQQPSPTSVLNVVDDEGGEDGHVAARAATDLKHL